MMGKGWYSLASLGEVSDRALGEKVLAACFRVQHQAVEAARRRQLLEDEPFCRGQAVAVDQGPRQVGRRATKRDPLALAESLKQMTGVVEHGLFIGMTDTCIVGGPDGPLVVGRLSGRRGGQPVRARRPARRWTTRPPLA